MRLITITLLFTFLSLQYKLWLGDSNILQWLKLEKKIATQIQTNEQSLIRNNAMAADITELKSGSQALEEHARYTLGMVKNSEIYYQFID